jgi:hypothetical protein
VAAQIVIDSTAEQPAIIKGSQAGNNTNITGKIKGKGVVEIQDANDNAFVISGVIANGDAEGDVLAVKVVTDSGVTFTGANTYSGGTVIAEGVTFSITNAAVLGTGAVTGAGTDIAANAAVRSAIALPLRLIQFRKIGHYVTKHDIHPLVS